MLWVCVDRAEGVGARVTRSCVRCYAGLSGFTDPPPVVLETDILEGLKDVMVLSVTCEMPNYSSMALLNAGQMTMDVMIGDVPLGVATSVGDVSFMFGAGNKQTFLVNVTRNNGNAGLIDEMVGNYTSGSCGWVPSAPPRRRHSLPHGSERARLTSYFLDTVVPRRFQHKHHAARPPHNCPPAQCGAEGGVVHDERARPREPAR